MNILRSTGGWAIVILVACFTACTGSGDGTSSSSTKFDQYFRQGEALYTTHCSNCHQAGGEGLGLVYPPLNKSDYMDRHFEQVLCMMRHGRSGELTVNGDSYIQPMPGIPALTDIQIAEIATYIYNAWGRQHGIVEVKDVSRIMAACETTD